MTLLIYLGIKFQLLAGTKPTEMLKNKEICPPRALFPPAGYPGTPQPNNPFSKRVGLALVHDILASSRCIFQRRLCVTNSSVRTNMTKVSHIFTSNSLSTVNLRVSTRQSIVHGRQPGRDGITAICWRGGTAQKRRGDLSNAVVGLVQTRLCC